MTVSTAIAPIRWDWTNTNQVVDLRNNALIKVLDVLFDKENCCRQAMGLPYVLATIPINVATAIGLIAEPLIKGVGNILGSCSSKECSFLRGLKQVILGVPGGCITAVYVSTMRAFITAIEVLIIPIWVAIDLKHAQKNNFDLYA